VTGPLDSFANGDFMGNRWPESSPSLGLGTFGRICANEEGGGARNATADRAGSTVVEDNARFRGGFVKHIPSIPLDPWYVPHRLALAVGAKSMGRDRPRTTGYRAVGAAVKGDRGFASMDRNRQREIASKGGKAAHQKGTAHEWTVEEAREAGRKGANLTRLRRHGSPESGQRPA
jgi:general stress protein YciG